MKKAEINVVELMQEVMEILWVADVRSLIRTSSQKKRRFQEILVRPRACGHFEKDALSIEEAGENGGRPQAEVPFLGRQEVFHGPDNLHVSRWRAVAS